MAYCLVGALKLGGARNGGRTIWVIGVSAPAVVTGMYLNDELTFVKGYSDF